MTVGHSWPTSPIRLDLDDYRTYGKGPSRTPGRGVRHGYSIGRQAQFRSTHQVPGSGAVKVMPTHWPAASYTRVSYSTVDWPSSDSKMTGPIDHGFGVSGGQTTVAVSPAASKWPVWRMLVGNGSQVR